MKETVFYITGGFLEIDKGVFSREVLKANSFIKQILLLNVHDTSINRPVIDKTTDSSVVRINYNGCSDVVLSYDYDRSFRDLKELYGQRISGRLTIRMDSYNAYHLTLDLNSKDIKLI